MLQLTFLIAFLGSTAITLWQESEDQQRFKLFSQGEITTEESAVFGCVLLLEGRTPEFQTFVDGYSARDRDALYEQMIFLDVNFHRGEITSFLFNRLPSEKMIAWAVECSASARNYKLSARYLALVENNRDLYQENAMQLLTTASSYGEPEMVLPLDLDQSTIETIVHSERLANRTAQVRASSESAIEMGMTSEWCEILIGYNVDSSVQLPKTEDEFLRSLGQLEDPRERFLIRFMFAAARIQAGDKTSAIKNYQILKREVDSDEKLLRSHMPEMSFLASRLEDDVFLQAQIVDIKLLSSRARNSLPAILAALAERGLYKDILEFTRRADRLRYHEVMAISNFGHFNESPYWEKVDLETRLRIENFLRWRELRYIK